MHSSEKGLSQEEANLRLSKYGPNEIKEEKKHSPIKIFLSQFKSFIVGVLIIAVVISLVIDEYLNAIVIGAILILNAVMGFVQEYKAEKAIEALKKMASLKAVVIRDGKEKKIDAKELIPGDVILLETGEKIPADARLIEVVNLQTQEAALTGESLPVKKEEAALSEDISVADRINMIFSGTIITKGRGKAVVTSTGMNSEIGKIAKMIQTAEAELTPLQKKLKILGEYMGAAAILISILVFLTGLVLGFKLSHIFMISLSLAVAAIPEGLPAVVTMALSLGTSRMVKRNALIRKLPSVETLGSTTVICTDKTGTLTLNQMTVRKIYANDKIISISGRGYETTGNFYHKKEKINPKEIELLLKTGVFCNDSKLSEGKVIGDPTEGALIVSAAKAGIDKKGLEAKYPRTSELQFDSERKMMSTQHRLNNKVTIFTKGAPDLLLEKCNRIYKNGKIERLTRTDKRKILKMNELFADQALRVLGFAYNESEKLEEKDMVFIGLQAMIDPPREEAKEAIERCKTAGIKVVMITGDFKITAQAIARELGLEGAAIDGKQLEKMHDLEDHVENIAVYARVDPKHKVLILDALKKRGHIVAMTGDGVNDAPALKEADIGISMGITGTDVAKEASDMILTDDNFASIVNAVEEGRGIYDNIKKFVEYLLSSNLGEVLTILIAMVIFAGTGGAALIPLLPLQILWINLVTDGPPALALGVEPAEPGIMQRKPRNPKENILKSKLLRMSFIGVIMMVGTLALFKAYNPEVNEVYARTVAFSVLMMFQMFNVINRRSDDYSIFKIGFFKNKKLLLAVFASIVLQIIIIHTPIRNIFHTVPLTGIDWLWIFLVSSSVFVFDEVYKLVKRRRKTQEEVYIK
ncbi:calcium-translocating P-type ATPase, SERCA-type [Candidatus Woesearchaeota archaeon]|nr:calcium-translocating P-type ATPase, SERCA-type [Candidatus Woesearchaeota archaeon]